MVIFNQTFKQGQPIYFPDNWQSGKTQIELYQEWKTTAEFAIISNVMQTVSASLFIFLIAIIVIAFKQLYRLSKLDDTSKQKIANKKYLKKSFIVPIGIIGMFSLAILGLLLSVEWTRWALLKGLACCILGYCAYQASKLYGPALKHFKTIAKDYQQSKPQAGLK